ncbi:MAG: amino acid adenylation domain-containing protein, partial [bacterium]
GIVADPEQRLSKLPLLTEAERHQLLVEWNDTRTDYPGDSCIHQLFEAQVERTPEKIAVVFEDHQLTYSELNARANQLAHYLRKSGVGPEVLVGICVERSLEMVIGLLGILKAGGAYVPLDPTYPRERLAFMLADAQVPVLLTQERLAEGFSEHSACDLLMRAGTPALPGEVVCLDADWEVIAQESEENPISGASAENLAYVSYTSGSTGKPKGVAMNHRPLCNLIWWQLQSSTLSGGARTLQFASLSFDVSFQVIFSTWCSGGTLILISRQLQRDAVGLLHFLTEESVERLFLPFVALHQLAQVADSRGSIPTSLREIIAAGEQLQITRHIASLLSKLKNCTLHNQYGPSESHVVTAFTLTGSPDDWSALPPIGRPIANTQIYILDANLQPVPIGVPGELHIGGHGLARGYLNRPDLAAEKFIPDPFSHEPRARLYKTGDLARYLPDGNIKFLGRLDHQVKIRAFRIELGEVETVLGQHPAIQETVVTVRKDIPGDKRLVAYVVLNQEQSRSTACRTRTGTRPRAPTTSELRCFLKEKLPDYMVPSAFVTLDALPLTPNGKVDRQGLPAPDRARPDLEGAYVAPRTPVEEMLAGIWTQVLGLEWIGVHDDFFELGGHSLLAMQVISRLRGAFQVELPLRCLFETPTVAELAQVIVQRQVEQADSETLAQILTEIEQLPEDAVRAILALEKQLIEVEERDSDGTKADDGYHGHIHGGTS